MKKSKLILLFALAILISVAGNAKAQDLIAEQVINTEEIDPELTYCPTYFAYSNEKNYLAFADDHDFEVVDATNKSILFKGYDLKNFRFFNKGQNFVAKYGKIIKIFETSNWTRYDSLSYNDQTILDFELSKDQKKLCVLFKDGTNLYPNMKIVIWNIETREIQIEQTINCEFNFQVTDKDEFVFLNMDWNESLNYLSLEWSLYTQVSTPFRSGRYFTKIYSLNENKMVKEYNHALSFKFDKDNSNVYFYEESYNSESKYCTAKELINILSLENDIKTTINLNFDQAMYSFCKDYLIVAKFPCAEDFYIVNKENFRTKILKSNYLHQQFNLSEDKTKLVSGLANNPCKIAIYDITNITDVSDLNNGRVFYPNPTSHVLNIELDQSLYYDIQIVNETGKIVASFPISNSNQLNYDTSRLPKGMYILRLNSKENAKSYKFLKE